MRFEFVIHSISHVTKSATLQVHCQSILQVPLLWAIILNHAQLLTASEVPVQIVLFGVIPTTI